MKSLILSLLITLVFVGTAHTQTTGYIYDFKQELEWRVTKHVSSVFDGATGDAHGDIGGTGASYSIFTVTGVVAVQYLFGNVNTLLDNASTGTLSLGVTGLVTQLTDASQAVSNFDAGDIFVGHGVSGNRANVGDLFVAAVNATGVYNVIIGDTTIIETAATDDIDSGQIDYYIVWAPLEVGASVVSP